MDTEAKLPAKGQASYIVVGVVPILMPSEEDLMILGARGRVGTESPKDPITPVDGTYVPYAIDIANNMQDMLALRVVTPKTLEPGPIKFYVLTDQEKPSNLCRPYNIGQDFVFYFSEYRTTGTKVPERKKYWNDLIANVSVGHLEPVEPRALRSRLEPESLDDPRSSAHTR